MQVPVELSANDTYGYALGAASCSPAAVINGRIVMFPLMFFLPRHNFVHNES